jgi:thioredoxin reductase
VGLIWLTAAEGGMLLNMSSLRDCQQTAAPAHAIRTRSLVIGGGPAGVAAALWLHQLGVQALLVDARKRLGGLQAISPYENVWVPGVRGLTGMDLAERMDQHLLAVGCPVRRGQWVNDVVPKDGAFLATLSDGSVVESAYVVVATGSRPRTGGFRSSSTVAIGPGLPLERLEVEGRSIAILGGGDNAFDAARFVHRRGARRVRLFSRNEPRAQQLLRDRVDRSIVHTGPFKADQQAMTINSERFDFISVQFGFEPNGLPGLAVGQRDDFIAVDRHAATSMPGVFACGEVTGYWHPCVVTSWAHGIQAAKSIARIEAEQALPERNEQRSLEAVCS